MGLGFVAVAPVGNLRFHVRPSGAQEIVLMPVPEDPPHLVFISHSAVDLWVANQIARHVETCGASAFLDEAEIAVGADFEDVILRHLEQADELLVLLTPWALERPYVWAELGAAWGRRIRIVGLLHGLSAADLRSRPEIPIFLKKRDLLELNKIDTYFSQLKRRIEATSTDEQT